MSARQRLALLAAFAGALGTSLVGCWGTECECPAIPANPEPEALSNLMLVFDGSPPRVERPPGSFELSNTEVVVSYQRGAAMVEARYAVHDR